MSKRQSPMERTRSTYDECVRVSACAQEADRSTTANPHPYALTVASFPYDE